MAVCCFDNIKNCLIMKQGVFAIGHFCDEMEQKS
jgi:hypothetical protein